MIKALLIPRPIFFPGIKDMLLKYFHTLINTGRKEKGVREGRVPFFSLLPLALISSLSKHVA